MGKVIDFTQRRRENIEQKKRQFERVLFKEVIGCYTAIEEGHKIVPIDMIDISPTGCLLEVPVSSKSDKELELYSDINIRLYFTKKSFISVVARIVRTEEAVNEKGVNVIRYGAEFDSSLPSFQVIQAFVSFIGKFAEFSQVDTNSRKVYFF